MTEKVIQFGEGNFLRGFVDYFIHKMNEQGLFNGSVVIVQPLEKGMIDMINEQNGEYNLYLRGIKNGEVVNERTHVTSISRCINPYHDFDAYMALAEQPEIRFIISNTTEAGIEFKEEPMENAPAVSYPAKLTVLLYKRFTLGLNGFILMPCELIDNNGKELKKCVLKYAKYWNLGEDFINWIENENSFCSTLVDRIVTGYPRAEAEKLWEELGYRDNVLDTAEIFHLWVIEGHHEDEFPICKAGFDVIWTDDVSPYKKRKVRILNGGHTSMVLLAYLYGLKNVKECLNDNLIRSFLEKCLFDEIIPTLGNKEEDIKFGKDVLERFANPFIEHMLLSIALNSVSKFKVRVLPTILEHKEKFGTYPKHLVFSLAALIAFYRTDDVNDSPDVAAFMKTASVADILKKTEYWDKDLTDMLPAVSEAYDRITANVKDAIEWIL